MWREIESRAAEPPRFPQDSNTTFIKHFTFFVDELVDISTETVNGNGTTGQGGVPVEVVYTLDETAVPQKIEVLYDASMLRPDTLYKVNRRFRANPTMGIIYNSRTGVLSHKEWVEGKNGDE